MRNLEHVTHGCGKAGVNKIRNLLAVVLVASACLLAPVPVHAAIPQQERDALNDLYNGSSGSGWISSTGWSGQAGTECTWYGVTCNAGQTSVTGINLSSNQLSGSIPSTLGNLTNLQVLDLSGNQLGGSIPSSLDNLTNLRVLDLSGNQLGGPIPSLLGIRSNLQVLDLSGNQLSGPIPPSLGNMTNLQRLYLSANQLSGSIPSSLGNLTNLQELVLSGNQLSGSIPLSLGSLTNLQELILLSNQLSGSIPSSLGNLTKLQQLVLFANQLSGSIPSSLGNLTNLQDLVLSGNQLSGSIPSSLGNLTNLLVLVLSSNQLSGTIPSSLGNLTKLIVLDLASNQLSGTIPPSLVSLTRLSSLGIAYNSLYTVDSTLSSFLDLKEPGWENTQTVAPTGIVALAQSDSSILVSWLPIAFTGYGGSYEVWSSTTSGGPYTLSGSTPDKSSSSLLLTGLNPGTYYIAARTVTYPNVSNNHTVVSDFSAENPISIGPQYSLNLKLSTGGAATSTTVGNEATTQAGYAAVTINSGAAPYGTAVFSYKQNGTIVSEAGVPASPPTTSARIFVDYGTGVTIRGSAGTVDISTGLAVVNNGNGTASITFTLRGLNGQIITSGTGSLAKGAHIAKYVNQLANILSGFSIPSSFPTSTRFGTLELTSDQPLSIVALRLTTNQRGDTLLTSIPIADLTRQLTSTPIYFPQLVNGGGYATTVILLNTSSSSESGTLGLYANDGSPLTVQQVNGPLGSSFTYSILPGGAYVFQTDASPTATNVGWVELTPCGGTSTPVGAGIFQYSRSGVLVTESGIPSATPTTHARVFVDTSGGHDTGLALGNPGNGFVSIALAAFQPDGSTQAGASQGPIALGSNGHAATFVDQQITGLPANFQGVLDIVSDSPFVALTLRSLVNERGDFLLTTFPVADMNKPAPVPIIFPQIAHGGGFTTEFILLSAGSSGAATISFFGDAGNPIAISLSH